MSRGLLNAPTPRRRSKTEIRSDIQDIESKIKEYQQQLEALKTEEKGIDTINNFARRKDDILFMDFGSDNVKFGKFIYDYNFDVTDDGMDDEDDDRFCADCGYCSSDINERASIDLAINNITASIESMQQALNFLLQQKSEGVKWIADACDCDAEEYDFDK